MIYFHLPVMRFMCVYRRTVNVLRLIYIGCLGRSNAILMMFTYASV